MQCLTANDCTKAERVGCRQQSSLMAVDRHLPARETSSSVSPFSRREVTTGEERRGEERRGEERRGEERRGEERRGEERRGEERRGEERRYTYTVMDPACRKRII